MDPIQPIPPGRGLPEQGPRPVDRLERITRERDRPASDQGGRRRRPPPQAPAPPPEDDEGRPRVDVRV